jgi:ATPase subunit of ABC transporter with duplicated ATPase domains
VALGIPATSVNVSFASQAATTAIMPTLIVGVLGVIDDVPRGIPTAIGTEPDAALTLLGVTCDELTTGFGPRSPPTSRRFAPAVDLARERPRVRFRLSRPPWEGTRVGYLDVNAVSFALPDGRPLLDAVSLQVRDGTKVALIGPNGAGKTTLMRIISGDLPAGEGAVTHTGGLGVMPQFIGGIRDESTVRELLVARAPKAIQAAANEVSRAEQTLQDRDTEREQLAYAEALANWADAGGYDYETLWDVCTVAALGIPFDQAQHRKLSSLSGGEQKQLALQALLRGPDEVLLLDEPDNYLDVPAKRELEQALIASPKTVLFVSHDRELLNQVPTRIASLEPGAAGATLWVHSAPFSTYQQAREDRYARLDEMRKRWDEEQKKLRALVLMYKQKASYNSDMASRYQAAQTRLARFEAAGPPEARPVVRKMRMRLTGGRTAKRALVCRQLELTGLMAPFDLEIFFGDRVAILGSNGSGKSHFLRLLAAGGSDPDPAQEPVSEIRPEPVAHLGEAKLGSRVRPGWFAQTHQHPELVGRTLLEILHRGDKHRDGRPREEAARVLDRYGLAKASEQTFESLSGGQQARFQILLLELSGAAR